MTEPRSRPARHSFDAIDENKKETATVALVLKLLPWMLGWFAMNAPSGLGLYWVFNNILTTTTTVLVKKVRRERHRESLPAPLAARTAAFDSMRTSIR